MGGNFIKDLYNQERYDEVIEMIKSLYCDLYCSMLNYKCQKYSNSEDYENLSVLIRNNYPQFRRDIIRLSVLESEPNTSYLEHIDWLLTSYMFMKKEYKNKDLEKNFNIDNIEDELIDADDNFTEE